MSGWIVYSKDGLTERCRLKSLEYSGSFMSDRSVTATFEYHSEVAFEVFDYIVYRGEKFELEAVPSVKKTSRNNYEYELRFVSLKYELERCEMRDIVPNDNGVVYPTPLTFSFTGDVEYLAERIQANLDALYGEGVWNIVVSDNTISDEKNITIGQQNCWNALSLVNTTYGLNFSVRGREVVIGGELESVSHTFQYGKGNGLYEIERVSDTDTGIVTKLRAYGSSRNLDYSYPKKPEWTDSVLPVSFALSPLRLMLPSFKEDGKTDFVLADESTIAKYGIREASIIYEDVYPSITDAKNSSGEAIDEIAGVDEVDESVNTFTVYLRDLGFDLNEHLTTSEAQLSMKTGTLQGYTFNISTIEKLSNGGYKLTLGKNSLEDSEESGAYVPNTNWNMSAGDKFVLLNILMPQTYIREAEQRLLSRAKEYLAEYGKTNFSYTIGLHDKFLMEHPAVYDSLIEGVKLKVYDDELGISEEVTIQSITITENIEDNILPQVKVTLNNKPSASTLDRIQGKLNDIANETASNSFTSQNELMKQYRKKLDKPFFDKLFVAIDEEGNEIASNDVTTPVSYIKAKYSFVTVGGMTMYAEGGDVDIPTIYDGLPIDNQTLVWEDTGGGKVLKINPNIDLGGGLDETQLAEYLTNNNYAKTSDITSALSGYATTTQLEAVNTRIDNFLEGSDTDGIINKWLELEAFLSGLSQSDNLADILSTKISKTEASAMFVTTDETEQTILGKKNFTGGLLVNGSPIYYDAENKYWKLEGDLLVTGGVTMYGDDGSGLPSIFDSLPIASNTALGIASFDSTYFSVDANGMVTLTSSPSSVSILSDLLDVDASVSGTATVDRVLYQAAGTSTWTWKELTSSGVTGDYLPLSGGTLSGSLLMQANPLGWLFIAKTNTSVMYAAHTNNYGVFASITNSDPSHYLLRLHHNDEDLQGSGNVAMLVKGDGTVHVGDTTFNFALNVAGDIHVTNWLRTNYGWYNELYGGGMYMVDNNYIRTYGGKILYIEETGLAATNTYGIGSHTLQLMIGGSAAPHSSIMLRSNTVAWGICSNANGNMYIGRRPHLSSWDYSSDVYVLEVSTSGLLCYGGITMYSDIRKKHKLQDVELSLSQIANAPLIRHYYNSDQNKTIHVGSIAQYWAGLNDWFCKLDNEGYYTMEIQNCALASAISIARELTRYESKTDKKIRQLKKRISQLEDEVELLKQERGYLC